METSIHVYNGQMHTEGRTRRRNLPWLTKEIVNLMKKRNYYFRKSNKYGRLEDLERYKKLRNKIVSKLRQCKAEFFQKVNPARGKTTKLYPQLISQWKNNRG